MSDTNENNVRLLDVSLIQVFLGLMRHRKSTLVAVEMGLTQPAISHALKRLRIIYGDQLFIRRPSGFEPTHLAIALEPALKQALNLLQGSISAPTTFDPNNSKRTITIAAYDYELATVLPPLIADLSNTKVQLHVSDRPLRGAYALEALADGEVDMVLSYFNIPKNRFSADLIYEDNYRLVARKNHNIFRSKITPASFANARHLLVSPDGLKRGRVDESLEKLGLARQVISSVPLFLPALSVLAKSDLIATLPGRVVDHFAELFDLTSAPLPFPTPPIPVSAVRHLRDVGNPMHKWLLERLRIAAGTFDARHNEIVGSPYETNPE